MKQGKTIQQLAAEIARQQEARRDFVAPTSQIGIAVTSENDKPAVKLVLGDGNRPRLTLQPAMGSNVVPMKGEAAFGINNYANGQLAEYVGMPKPYYDRCLRQAPHLLAENVNYWLGNQGMEKRLVRTLDGNVRALLSDRYRPLDNAELAEAVLPVIEEQELFIASCEITETRLYIKAFDKRIEREILLKGADPAHAFLKDVVFPAIVISNSEVGAGSLSVAAGLYTGGCTNFAAFSDSRMKKYHVGGRYGDSSEVRALLTDETKAATDKALWLQTRDIVKSAFEIARFEELVGRVQETTEQKIEGDVVKVVEVTSKQFGFTKEEGGSILKRLIEGGTLSRYGLFNAITRAAEDLPDYERASEFERAGGELIELPRNAWERLAKAA